MYSRKMWLNKEQSPSLGSVAAFDGEITYDKKKKYRSTVLSISDCYSFIKLHKTDDDSMDDFINKLKLLQSEIGLFVEYLEKSK